MPPLLCVVALLLLGGSAVSGQGRDPHGNAAPNVILGSKNTLNVHHGKPEVEVIDYAVSNAIRAIKEEGRKREAWEAVSGGRLSTA